MPNVFDAQGGGGGGRKYAEYLSEFDLILSNVRSKFTVVFKNPFTI